MDATWWNHVSAITLKHMWQQLKGQWVSWFNGSGIYIQFMAVRCLLIVLQMGIQYLHANWQFNIYQLNAIKDHNHNNEKQWILF